MAASVEEEGLTAGVGGEVTTTVVEGEGPRPPLELKGNRCCGVER